MILELRKENEFLQQKLHEQLQIMTVKDTQIQQLTQSNYELRLTSMDQQNTIEKLKNDQQNFSFLEASKMSSIDAQSEK